ncbi:putative transferase, protein kinase RLK-Pelle-LRR-I-1 family [Helianthus annuus]|uniref:non-specific serine/threonine protein kinase n=2 Tax=Helianthus annuus TaxID=4232 RepID=A0A251VRU5_HELAN|nr:putative transferase, protein kinase RLK-Pelle-LRR-I-1 family [Helianthus annuus]
MALFRNFYYVLMLQVALTIAMVHAQDDQSGFISIDCGITEGSDYTDKRTGINYVSDARFIDSGINQEISSMSKSDTLDIQFSTLRSFPQNTRNCYTLRPKQGKGNRYLIRARFNYGNYDLKGQPPKFDLYLGNDPWSRVNVKVSSATDYEIIHLASSDYIYVCLVNIGLGNPFISALELRLLDSTMYADDKKLRSLTLSARTNFGTSKIVRYADDKYDRIWYPIASTNTKDIQTSSPISLGSSTKESVPSKVMSTAVIPANPTADLFYSWTATDKTEEYFMYIHYAEIETLEGNETREFNIYLNDAYWDGPISPTDHTTSTYFTSFYNASSYELTLRRTINSTLPTMMNAIELYNPIHLQQRQTDDKDATTMWSTKSTYGLKRNWQGDPCVPQDSMWDGVKCSNDTDNLRIISMNLSFSGLSGEITPALANLTVIQSLDLSYNNLTGSVPTFLASLNFLKNLNLTGNNFTRPLPAELLKKAKNGSLFLSIEEDGDQDTDACSKGSCKKSKTSKNKNVVIVVIATVAAIFVLLTILIVLWITKRRRAQDSSIRDEFIEPRNQRFTYSEVQRITNSFSNVIGKGGFGTVFSGLIGDTRAAVKMLSESSAQGCREFQSEVHLLMSVHHKNITSLVGYCDEGSHKGIIYEYMANGNLGMHLFDASQNVLSWKKRLQIGYDAAQGLEYMHHGCKPPIVHRDVKCSNILLNEKLQAKLADFGLSRAFTTEGATHVSTVIAGTPGYLDPEYYTTNRLTEKSDVYSFGVVLLELITGRAAISTDIYIVNWVKSMVEKGSVENIIDPRLYGDFDVNTAWKMVELAMACVDMSSVKRPTMNDVVMELQTCLKGAKPNNLNHSMSLSLESMSGPNLR